MSTVLLLMRVMLGLVFGAAAVGKIANPAGLRATLEEFRLPSVLAAPTSVLLPLVELAIAGLLVPAGSARPAAAAALVLLVVFCGAIVTVVVRGVRPSCGCFGRAHSARVGPATLVRNGVLGAIAALLVVDGPGRGLGSAVSAVDVSAAGVALVVISLLLLLLGWFLWQLFRQNGRLVERVGALEASPAYAYAEEDEDEESPAEHLRALAVG